MCYSDHDHDIDMVGVCEMCEGTEYIGIIALEQAREEAEAWLRILS